MSIVIFDEAIRKLDVSDALEEAGNAVADHARGFSQVPAGIYPNTSGHPWVRSGQLNQNIDSVLGNDENGGFVDVGTDAVARGFPYGYHLEASGRFTYLTAALQALDIPFNRI